MSPLAGAAIQDRFLPFSVHGVTADAIIRYPYRPIVAACFLFTVPVSVTEEV